MTPQNFLRYQIRPDTCARPSNKENNPAKNQKKVVDKIKRRKQTKGKEKSQGTPVSKTAKTQSNGANVGYYTQRRKLKEEAEQRRKKTWK